MPTQFRQTIATVALLMVSGALSAATAQTIITTEPAQTRTIVREPLNLTPTQRTTIYRTIIPQGKGKQPIVKEREVRETVGRSAPVRERVVTEPTIRERVVIDPPVQERLVVDPLARERVVVDPLARDRVVTTTPTVDYVIGDRVPASISLNPFPERVVREVPATSGYRYMVVNDRLLLVDPVTSTVVQEIRNY